ncbi:hypothetical protein EXU57_07145 [Segetibacter sp. 3557_3]|uniref:hypothetical protein n=1 Tax=Segetibacter sp. 3557_3 TaxID=2547429 RepID=UPI00105848BD|nr:hypothetical protein [Segetibacter sp. 3557_3]TDH27355.1 hypothetical protein EXU57_07145 [Segetibacter sp. 3557_3]
MKRFAFVLLSIVLFSSACKKDQVNKPAADVNGVTEFTVAEEKEFTYTFTAPETHASILNYNGKKQLNIKFSSVYAESTKPFKAEIVINDFTGPGKYTLDKEGTLAVMTDDNRDGDAYWANYYNQSGYGSYTKQYSPRTYLTVTHAANGKLVADIDMKLWHNLVASGYSMILDVAWKGRVVAELE